MVYAGGFTSAAVAITPVNVAFFPVIFQQIKLLISCLKTLTKTILISRRNLFLPSAAHLFVFFLVRSPTLSCSLFCCCLFILLIFFSCILFVFQLSRRGWLPLSLFSVVYGKLSAFLFYYLSRSLARNVVLPSPSLSY